MNDTQWQDALEEFLLFHGALAMLTDLMTQELLPSFQVYDKEKPLLEEKLEQVFLRFPDWMQNVEVLRLAKRGQTPFQRFCRLQGQMYMLKCLKQRKRSLDVAVFYREMDRIEEEMKQVGQGMHRVVYRTRYWMWQAGIVKEKPLLPSKSVFSGNKQDGCQFAYENKSYASTLRTLSTYVKQVKKVKESACNSNASGGQS